MGCDIHGWVEKKVNDKWVAYLELRDRERNYERFAALAGVRGEGPQAKGVPPDVSETTKLHIDEEGADGHSHSYMALTEAYKIFRETNRKKFYSEHDAFGVDDYGEGYGDYRIVFWFDN